MCFSQVLLSTHPLPPITRINSSNSDSITIISFIIIMIITTITITMIIGITIITCHPRDHLLPAPPAGLNRMRRPGRVARSRGSELAQDLPDA